jgi:HEAT repeat protein
MDVETFVRLPLAGTVACVVIAPIAAWQTVERVRVRRAARHRSRVARLRAQALAVAVGRIYSVGPLPAVATGDGEVIDRILVDFVQLLRGPDKTALVRILELRGTIESARQRTNARSPLVRARAAERLGTLGTRLALDDLARLLDDRSAEVRAVAARALGKLEGAGIVPVLLASLDGPRRVPESIVAEALATAGPACADDLREGLRNPSAVVRAIAAGLIGQLGVTVATDDLIVALGDSDARTRAAATAALGRIGSPRATGPLVRVLAHAPLDERRAAICALGAIGSPSAVPLLASLLDSNEAEVPTCAAQALSQMGRAGRLALRFRSSEPGLPGSHARDALTRADGLEYSERLAA